MSIISPVYNHRAYIGTCIESVLAQTYENWEQIVIDDGSSDGTSEVIKRHGDQRISYFRQENRGPFELAATYNTALSLAQGELIAILEGDDFWPANKLATLVPSFMDPEIVLAYGEALDVDPKGYGARVASKTSRARKKLLSAVLLNDPVGSATRHMLTAQGRALISPSTVLLRRTVLDGIGGFQSVAGLPLTDYPTFVTLSLLGKFRYTQDVMGFRRRHEQSITVNYAENIHRKVCDYTRGFVEAHRTELALSGSQFDQIEKTWTEAECTLHFSEGRRLLLQRCWSEARHHLLLSAKSRSVPLFMASLAALLCSWARTDIEFLMRWRGRPQLRST